MANEEQLKRLLAGMEGWNKWREENPDIRIDLKGADLRKANLSRADLNNAYFSQADLREANLSDANLKRTNLVEADLTKADLSGAYLVEADLRGANLRKADFIGTRLNKADLSGTVLIWACLLEADLRATNLKAAGLGGTVLGIIDLSETIGLDDVVHHGPSQISIDTLQRSKGKIPVKFLRGCGLSDWEIESAKLYQPGLSPKQVTEITYNVCQLRKGNPIQYYSCFISYSSKDEEFTKQLYDDFQENGVRCWFAPEDLKIGDKFRGRIDDAIRVHEKLLIILSENSIKSSWVEKEIESAFEKERKNGGTVLFPIRLDDGVMNTDQSCAADIRRSRHIGDFSNWKDKEKYQKAFERLLKDLKAVGNKEN